MATRAEGRPRAAAVLPAGDAGRSDPAVVGAPEHAGGAGQGAAPLDLFHATDYRIVRMDCPVVATLHDALPISHPEWASPKCAS
jgi:hypothetical protein